MSKFKYVLLAVAIAIVFAFFVGFGIASFYREPKYDDFCDEEFFPKPYPRTVVETTECPYTEPDDELKAQCKDKGDISANYDEDGCVESYYCETCRKEYEDVRENYNRNVFIVATGIGIIVLIIGFALKMASVSSGLMGGGILTIIYGTMRYWSDLPDIGRFIILGITLAILIWLGYKKLKQ
tara:strand:- start:24769 stop:25314 length:546 start_codon:yes stop_codon:yes gene_type:complete